MHLLGTKEHLCKFASVTYCCRQAEGQGPWTSCLCNQVSVASETGMATCVFYLVLFSWRHFSVSCVIYFLCPTSFVYPWNCNTCVSLHLHAAVATILCRIKSLEKISLIYMGENIPRHAIKFSVDPSPLLSQVVKPTKWNVSPRPFPANYEYKWNINGRIDQTHITLNVGAILRQ